MPLLPYYTFDPRVYVAQPNAARACLEQEAALFARLYRDGGIRRTCAPEAWHDREPHLFMPRNGRRFEYTTQPPGVPVGAAGSTASCVRFTVPNGWDGVIISLIALFDGSPGLNEASGDLVWRILIDNLYYAPTYGNIATSLGALQNRYALEGAGIIVYSQQTVDFQVQFVNPAPLDPAGTVVCSFAGWFWPK